MERRLTIILTALNDEVGPVEKTDLRMEYKYSPTLADGIPSFLEGLLGRFRAILSMNAISTDECKHERAHTVFSAPDNFYSYKGVCDQCGKPVKTGWVLDAER